MIILKNPGGGSNCFPVMRTQATNTVVKTQFIKQWELSGTGLEQTLVREWPFPTLLHSCLTYLPALRLWET